MVVETPILCQLEAYQHCYYDSNRWPTQAQYDMSVIASLLDLTSGLYCLFLYHLVPTRPLNFGVCLRIQLHTEAIDQSEYVW